MATARTAIPVDATGGVVCLEGVRWRTYEAMLRDLERAGSNLRLTYDRGSLEIMSPYLRHESPKKYLARVIEALTEELNIPVRSGGSTTFKRRLKRRGLEPDECYWIANEHRVRGLTEIDLDRDPPPDLAIEIENTNRLIDRQPIYAALGFPEIWRFDGQSLQAGLLQPGGDYAWGDTSASLPAVRPSELLPFIESAWSSDETAWIRGFREWVRAKVLPRAPGR